MLEKNSVENSELLFIGQIKTAWPLLLDKPYEITLRSGLNIRYRERKYEGERLIDLTYQIDRRWLTQTIVIENWPVHFGQRKYWQCQCGRPCTILYFNHDCPSGFACRDCLKLKYNLTYLNRETKIGKLMYATHLSNKLRELQKRIKRIEYRNKYTRKASRYISLSKKLGGISINLD